MIKNLDINKFSFGSINKKLFTFKELEFLLNLRPFTNVERFIPCNNTKKYHWDNSPWCTDNNCWPASVIKKQIKNSTCYLKDSSRVNKNINSLADKLEKKFNYPVDCHIYFSLNENAKSFKKHKDKRPNLIVGCEGKTQFKIFYNNKIIKKILNKGAYIFIPAGVYHEAVALTEKRISCSFAFHPLKNQFLEDRKWIQI